MRRKDSGIPLHRRARIPERKLHRIHRIFSALDPVNLVNLTLPGVCLIPCRETRSWTHLHTGSLRERIKRNLANFSRLSRLPVWYSTCTCIGSQDDEAIIEHTKSEQDVQVTTVVLVQHHSPWHLPDNSCRDDEEEL
jgi:hypothetical protein